MRTGLVGLLFFLSYSILAAPLMYRVEAPLHMDAPCSYLLGSYHLASARSLPGRIMIQFVRSDRLVMESSLRPSPIVDTSIPPEILLTDTKLSRLLSPKAFAFVESKLVPKPIPNADILDKIHPSAIAEILWDHAYQSVGDGHMDGDFERLALQRNIETIYLETLEQLKKEWEKRSAGETPQLNDMEGSLFLINNLHFNWDLILGTFRHQHKVALSAFLEGDTNVWGVPITCTDQDAFLLQHRNRLWLPSLKLQVDAGNSFIVVGLSHLLHDYGLVRALEKAGYRLTPVQPSDVGN